MSNPLNRLYNAQRKQLILTILNSTATKRETKNYFLKYQPKDLLDAPQKPPGLSLLTDDAKSLEKPIHPLRLSLVKIRALDKIPMDFLRGIGITLLKMIRLGCSPIIVLEDGYKRGMPFTQARKGMDEQYNVLLEVVENSMRSAFKHEKDTRVPFRLLRGLNSLSTVPMKLVFEVDSSNGVHLTFPQEILDHLRQGTVPIIYPVGYSLPNAEQLVLPSNLVVENLAANLHHYSRNAVKDSIYGTPNKKAELSVEKIIYIDPLGGIPSLERMSSSHVLINLQQEYEEIENELQKGFLRPKERNIHTENLTLLHDILMHLPDSAAAIVTTPSLAAINDAVLDAPEDGQSEGVEQDIKIKDTYDESYSYSALLRQAEKEDKVEEIVNQRGESVNSFKIKNPIIYNILTDRPLISPSLPVFLRNTPLINTTVIRKGIDLKCAKSDTVDNGLDLRQMNVAGTINLRKLKELIDDSFRRHLDLEGYLDRVNGKVAGLIIAGDYEAGAIITWEKMNFKDSQGKDVYVPYLDKFAVKRSLQGTFSAADIVFKVMVNTLFPKEILWRSRQNNPVNKWYHERSKGSMAVPDTHWRCFWAGNEVSELPESLQAYVEVCQKIKPNWLD